MYIYIYIYIYLFLIVQLLLFVICRTSLEVYRLKIWTTTNNGICDISTSIAYIHVTSIAYLHVTSIAYSEWASWTIRSASIKKLYSVRSSRRTLIPEYCKREVTAKEMAERKLLNSSFEKALLMSRDDKDEPRHADLGDERIVTAAEVSSAAKPVSGAALGRTVELHTVDPFSQPSDRRASEQSNARQFEMLSKRLSNATFNPENENTRMGTRSFPDQQQRRPCPANNPDVLLRNPRLQSQGNAMAARRCKSAVPTHPENVPLTAMAIDYTGNGYSKPALKSTYSLQDSDRNLAQFRDASSYDRQQTAKRTDDRMSTRRNTPSEILRPQAVRTDRSPMADEDNTRDAYPTRRTVQSTYDRSAPVYQQAYHDELNYQKRNSSERRSTGFDGSRRDGVPRCCVSQSNLAAEPVMAYLKPLESDRVSVGSQRESGYHSGDSIVAEQCSPVYDVPTSQTAWPRGAAVQIQHTARKSLSPGKSRLIFK